LRHAPSYLAALIDGEGSVGWRSNGANRKKRFQIDIEMTDEAVIDWLHAKFGGNKYHRKRHQRLNQTHFKPIYLWRLTGTAAITLYKSTESLMIAKKGRLDNVHEVPAE